MLSYQHSYHAGGPADVHKHIALSVLLGHFRQKEKPFCVIDLYAGDGVYDLTSAEAGKTKEFAAGIGRLWPNLPAKTGLWADLLRELNPHGHLTRYPGSPAIARHAMRADDRLILNELHPTAYRTLRYWAADDPRITPHKRDGLEAMIGLTPPAIRRGLVIIDPSYEIKTEYAGVPEKIAAALKKWAEGVYFVWYPILVDARHRALLDGMLALDAEIFGCELTLPATQGLIGTGLAIVNPPWRFDDSMRDLGATLAEKLGGRHTAKWLKRSSS